MLDEMINLEITVVGLDILRTVQYALKPVNIKLVNPVNRGKLGNFKTLTFLTPIRGEEFMNRRKDIMAALANESTHLLSMYAHGNVFHVYIFNRLAFLEG